MKFIAVLSLLVASISASPIEAREPGQVTVALSNDQSGAYAGVTFPADGLDKSVQSLFGSTSVGSSGSVKATSAQITAFPQTINCVIKDNAAAIATLTAQHTYADLDGNPKTSILIDLSTAVINCHA